MATLEELREATGMTQGQLAAKLAVPPTQGAAWERGTERPTTREIGLLALALGMKPPQVQDALAETQAEERR